MDFGHALSDQENTNQMQYEMNQPETEGQIQNS